MATDPLRATLTCAQRAEDVRHGRRGLDASGRSSAYGRTGVQRAAASDQGNEHDKHRQHVPSQQSILLIYDCTFRSLLKLTRVTYMGG